MHYVCVPLLSCRREQLIAAREHQQTRPVAMQEARDREREMVEAVVARIEAEDRQAEAQRAAQRERIQEAMRQSVADRRQHQAALRAQEEEEERRWAS